MYYFDLYQLYEPKHLTKAYRRLANDVRTTKAEFFPIYLTSWIMAILSGCCSALYNLFFYCGYDAAAANRVPIQIVSDLFAYLGKYINGNFFLMFLGGFVFVSLIPLAIGLIIRRLMVLVSRPFMRVPSQNGMTDQQKLRQMHHFCAFVSEEHEVGRGPVIFPVISVLGTTASIMYMMALDDPTVLDSSIIEWIIAIVAMLFLCSLLCLSHFLYFGLNFHFSKPSGRSREEIAKAIHLEEERLEQGQEIESYYNKLRAELRRQEEEKREQERLERMVEKYRASGGLGGYSGSCSSPDEIPRVVKDGEYKWWPEAVSEGSSETGSSDPESFPDSSTIW